MQAMRLTLYQLVCKMIFAAKGQSETTSLLSRTRIFENFLHTEYGGPGTLLVLPFIDMADTLNERGLPGEPQAARAAVKWAQENVDKDWKEWTGSK
ncbi:protein PLASTID REDOX INSENSITIVE 2, chloroplastic-like isoform X2 [Amaranthus tricolor]|uniref:protein PLASTID REDOX INSENSITIVE 2, chloroplastic-like isoform X2 n=1 Tax=Amaranthus tricolor TaxID=29722 RepID=UPI002586C766|nr:protein PLASTID REDOX INSENSITIVE 2, chloroplastic-like isoform X2 [Amaranthus tricolor]